MKKPIYAYAVACGISLLLSSTFCAGQSCPRSQSEELYTLPQLGITALSLDSKLARRTDQYGNSFRYRAKVASNQPGVAKWAWDVILVGTAETTPANLKNKRSGH